MAGIFRGKAIENTKLAGVMILEVSRMFVLRERFP